VIERRRRSRGDLIKPSEGVKQSAECDEFAVSTRKIVNSFLRR
jgi:hypothetical protein